MIKAGIILFLSYAAVVAFMYFLQDSLLYFPQKELSQTPGDINLEYEEINLKAKDGTEISGWFVGARDEKGVVLFCHGNAGNISHRLDSIKIFNTLNLSVMIFDYRGYGKSRGKPTEQGTYLDAEAAWDYLIRTKQKTPESITLFGRSLGGAVAAEIAFRKNPGRLIIESGFTSVTELAKNSCTSAVRPVLGISGKLFRNIFPYALVRNRGSHKTSTPRSCLSRINRPTPCFRLITARGN